MADDISKTNLLPLSLHVPEPKYRPGDTVDYSDVDIPPAGAQPRPDVSSDPATMREMVYDMVRVLDDDYKAIGPWDPKLSDDTLLKMLKTMAQVRAFDDRLHRMQRQGKTSFYMKCTGEEATSVAAAMALDSDDMCFPSYRQQGILFVRGYPMVDMINQIFSNREDKLKGRQLPIMYCSRRLGFFFHFWQSRDTISAGCGVGDGQRSQRRYAYCSDLVWGGVYGGRRLPQCYDFCDCL